MSGRLSGMSLTEIKEEKRTINCAAHPDPRVRASKLWMAWASMDEDTGPGQAGGGVNADGTLCIFITVGEEMFPFTVEEGRLFADMIEDMIAKNPPPNEYGMDHISNLIVLIRLLCDRIEKDHAPQKATMQ